MALVNAAVRLGFGEYPGDRERQTGGRVLDRGVWVANGGDITISPREYYSEAVCNGYWRE